MKIVALEFSFFTFSLDVEPFRVRMCTSCRPIIVVFCMGRKLRPVEKHQSTIIPCRKNMWDKSAFQIYRFNIVRMPLAVVCGKTRFVVVVLLIIVRKSSFISLIEIEAERATIFLDRYLIFSH